MEPSSERRNMSACKGSEEEIAAKRVREDSEGRRRKRHRHQHLNGDVPDQDKLPPLVSSLKTEYHMNVEFYLNEPISSQWAFNKISPWNRILGEKNEVSVKTGFAKHKTNCIHTHL